MSITWTLRFLRIFHNDLNGEDSTMKRLTRMVTHLPTKAITLPVNGSVRIIKGSAKQVKKIRNIKKAFIISYFSIIGALFEPFGTHPTKVHISVSFSLKYFSFMFFQ